MSAASVASYTWGQCTYYVAQTLSWIPAGLGNAANWASNAAAKGLKVTSTPSVGSAVVWGPGQGYSSVGHVAVVTSVNPNGSFTVSEMNYQGVDKVDTRVVNTLRGVEGFIQPPNGSAPVNPALWNATLASESAPLLHNQLSHTLKQPNGSIFAIHGENCSSFADISNWSQQQGESGALGVSHTVTQWAGQPCKWITLGLILGGAILAFSGLRMLASGTPAATVISAPARAVKGVAHAA
jgi:hypothetical protein